MTGNFESIENAVEKNKNFRKVVFTGKHPQLVVMSLSPKEEIGNEVLPDVHPLFRIEGHPLGTRAPGVPVG